MAIVKRSTTSWIVTLLLLSQYVFPTHVLARHTHGELTILNWADYMDPALIRQFEQEFHTRVYTPYFESDDHRTELLSQSPHGYDLVVVDSPSIDTYRKADWLEPVPIEQIPNLVNIEINGQNLSSDLYSVPFFWGTLGIAYREDLVDSPPQSWMDLFRPRPAWQGKIAIYPNTLDIMGAALKALGYSINSTEESAYQQVEQLLQSQKPRVRTYDYLSLNSNSALIRGDVIAIMSYNGDALILQEHDPRIQFIVPQEGAPLWVDHLVVLKSSQNKALAWAFIDFINRPEHAAQLAQYVYTATPNKAAESLLPWDFLNDPVIYPDYRIRQKLEFNSTLPARIARRRNEIVTRLLIQ